MTRRVYLHVGPFKTGSTYVQGCLRGRRQELADRGVLFPLPQGRSHPRAVIDLLARGRERRSTTPAAGSWKRAATLIRRWSGDSAVISGEALSSARIDTVERALDTLAPAEVHVVATMRSLASLVPSFWQSNLRNRKSVTWAGFMASLRGEEGADPQFGERFWRMMDVSTIMRLWAERVPVDRLHVVVMPPSTAPSRELWDRFCAAIAVADPPDPATEEARNVAVGTEQAEALRRLNAGLAGEYPDYLYARFVKQVATRGAVRGATDARKMVLPPEDFGWAREQSQRIVDDVLARGCHVVGDPNDAVPSAPSALTPDGPFRPDDYRLEKVADAATRMSLALLMYMRADEKRNAPSPIDDVQSAEIAQLDDTPDDDGDQKRLERRERRRERRGRSGPAGTSTTQGEDDSPAEPSG